MDRGRLRQACEALDDLDLAGALTLKRADHDAAFLAEAEAELVRRDTSLAAVLDRVTLQTGSGPGRPVTVAEAVASVHDDVPRRAVAGFTRCLGDTLLLQREGWGWVLHHYEAERYGLSYLVKGTAPARDLLQRFLRLQDWTGPAGEGHHLDDWKTLVADEDAEVVLALADRLAAGDVPHVVRPAVFTPEDDDRVAILVPPAHLTEAAEVAGTGRTSVRRLHARAGAADAAGDLPGELAAYDELVEVDGDNHAVHYNRGVVLLELDRPDDAAAAFMEAAACGLERGGPHLSLSRTGGGGGLGLFAVVARLVGRAAGASGPVYPDWIDDVELRLEDLATRLGPRVDLLHSLASLARLKGDEAAAAARYRAILDLAPGDEVARLQLELLAPEAP